MINVDVSKSSREHTINLVCGDRRTSRIRIRINRYADGVDLSGLAWSVSYKNSAGAGNTDVIGVVDVCGSDLRFEWTIPDAVSAVSGISQFFVFGTDGNRKWQSDIMRINVADAMTAPAEYDEESASELDVLISNATVKVNELVSEYENIIDRIDNVIDDADTRITDVINDINSRIESGEFKGEDGNDGYTPVKNIDYFDGEDGYTPVKGVDYFTDAEKQSMVDSIKDTVQPSVSELNTGLEELSDVVDGKADLSDIPDISGKLDTPADAPTVGTILRVKSVNADGSFVCEWAEEQDISGKADKTELLKVPSWDGGLRASGGTDLYVLGANQDIIDKRSSESSAQYRAINAKYLDYAVNKSLSDCKDTTLWTDDAKAKACATMGALYDKYELIEKIDNWGGNQLVRTTDLNGNPYNYKHMAIIVRIAKTNSSDYIAFRAGDSATISLGEMARLNDVATGSGYQSFRYIFVDSCLGTILMRGFNYTGSNVSLRATAIGNSSIPSSTGIIAKISVSSHEGIDTSGENTIEIWAVK